MDQALAVRSKTAGVWIALAAGWSGGSMAPPNVTRVPPPVHATPRCVNTGILMALARVEPKNRASTLKAFVDMNISLATR